MIGRRNISCYGWTSRVAKNGKALKTFGMSLNFKKSSTPSYIYDAKFQRYQVRNGIPLKPLDEFWAALVHPEHPDRSWDDYTTRACGLVLATFAQHNEFYDTISKQSVEKPFLQNPKPSRRIFMQNIGFDTVPHVLPSKHTLVAMGER